MLSSKIVHGLSWRDYHLKPCLHFMHNTVTTEVMGTGYLRNSVISIFGNLASCSERVIDDWNHLPTFLIKSPDVLTFKTIN